MPFLLAHATTTPLSSLMQIIARPQNKELAFRNSGLAQIFRPFVGFFVFCVGKLFITISVLTANCLVTPSLMTKPFSTYSMIGVLMLAPLGLHFFLAYQEFAFYSICSYYRAFAKRVLATSEEEQKCFQVLPTQPNQRAEQKTEMRCC